MLGVGRHHAKLLKAEAGIDPLDPQLQKPQEMGNFPGRARGAHVDRLLRAVDPQPDQGKGADAEAPGLQDDREIVQHILHDLRDGVGRADRLQQTPLDAGRIFVLDSSEWL